MTQQPLDNRISGCLFGGALGDAIGSYFEGDPPNNNFTIPPNLRVTDDTQLTIATCQSIVDSGSVDPESVARHFLNWYRDRRIVGIGASTLKSLTELDVGGHWAMVGATGEQSAGNGAAMRIAPLAFVLDPDIDAERQKIRDVCRITHRNDEAYLGALAIVRSIRYVISGNSLDDALLTMLINAIPDSRVRDRLIVVRDSSLSIEEYASQFATSGYVVDSVPLAILAAIRSTDFLTMIENIVHCGGDTDTIASMCGQIFGTAYGVDALPMETANKIDAVNLVRETAANFTRASIATEIG